MIIRNVDALLGEELEYVRSTDIAIRDGTFQEVDRDAAPRPGEERADCEGMLLIPGLVNCHTHVGDSIAKDVALDGTVDGRVHPVHGLKSRVLGGTSDSHLVEFMRAACRSMVGRGVTTFVDFREGGLPGIALLRRAIRGLGIRPVILGRVERYHNAEQVRRNADPGEGLAAEMDGIVDACDGIGISGANENSDAALKLYSDAPKLRAIHAAETECSVRASRDMTGRSEVERALVSRPHFLVHMTHASAGDLRVAAGKTRGIVVCPRANGALAGGVPDVFEMLRQGCNVAIGSDNVMVNTPDMFREMDYIWKVSMGRSGTGIDPREILKMATVNASRILGRDVGVVRPGAPADAILIEKHALDLEPVHNPYAAVVHRASESAVRAVMIGGSIFHGRL